MAITAAAFGTAAVPSTTPVTAPAPSGVAINDLLLIWLIDATTPITFTISGSTGWTQITSSGQNCQGILFYKNADSTDVSLSGSSGSYSLTPSAAHSTEGIFVRAPGYGFDPVPTDAGQYVSTTGTSFPYTGVTTTRAGDTILFFGANRIASGTPPVLTLPSGFASLLAQANTSAAAAANVGVFLGTQTQAVAGATGTKTCTDASASDGGAFMVALALNSMAPSPSVRHSIPVIARRSVRTPVITAKRPPAPSGPIRRSAPIRHGYARVIQAQQVVVTATRPPMPVRPRSTRVPVHRAMAWTPGSPPSQPIPLWSVPPTPKRLAPRLAYVRPRHWAPASPPSQPLPPWAVPPTPKRQSPRLAYVRLRMWFPASPPSQPIPRWAVPPTPKRLAPRLSYIRILRYWAPKSSPSVPIPSPIVLSIRRVLRMPVRPHVTGLPVTTTKTPVSRVPRRAITVIYRSRSGVPLTVAVVVPAPSAVVPPATRRAVRLPNRAGRYNFQPAPTNTPVTAAPVPLGGFARRLTHRPRARVAQLVPRLSAVVPVTVRPVRSRLPARHPAANVPVPPVVVPPVVSPPLSAPRRTFRLAPRPRVAQVAPKPLRRPPLPVRPRTPRSPVRRPAAMGGALFRRFAAPGPAQRGPRRPLRWVRRWITRFFPPSPSSTPVNVPGTVTVSQAVPGVTLSDVAAASVTLSDQAGSASLSNVAGSVGTSQQAGGVQMRNLT